MFTTDISWGGAIVCFISGAAFCYFMAERLKSLKPKRVPDKLEVEGKKYFSLEHLKILRAATERGADVHTAVASWLGGVPPERITEKQRQKAKLANLKFMYMTGPETRFDDKSRGSARQHN